MKTFLPGITLKTVISCAAVSFLISFGTCSFYLYVKAIPYKLSSENDTHYTYHLWKDISGGSRQGQLKRQE